MTAGSLPSSHFVWPSKTLNFNATLTAAVLYMPPGHCVVIKNAAPMPATHRDLGSELKDYYHGTLPSRLSSIIRNGLAPTLGAGASRMELAFGILPMVV